MPEDYEPGTGPYDWRRATDHWGRAASDAFVRAGEFYAVIDHMSEKLDALHDGQLEIRERLMDTRARRLAGDLASSVLMRFVVIVVAVLTAFLLTNVINVRWPPW